jgi:hypothetical protein
MQRLNQIKKTYDNGNGYSLYHDDMMWLIGQAEKTCMLQERVDLLERKITWWEGTAEEHFVEIKRMKDLYYSYNKEIHISDNLRSILDRVAKEIEKANLEEDICKCTSPQREIKLVEGKRGLVKDVYCQKCELPIYK